MEKARLIKVALHFKGEESCARRDPESMDRIHAALGNDRMMPVGCRDNFHTDDGSADDGMCKMYLFTTAEIDTRAFVPDDLIASIQYISLLDFADAFSADINTLREEFAYLANHLGVEFVESGLIETAPTAIPVVIPVKNGFSVN